MSFVCPVEIRLLVPKMEVEDFGYGHCLIQGDSGQTYDVDLRRESCPCRWGTFRLSRPEKKECKHLALAKHYALMRL